MDMNCLSEKSDPEINKAWTKEALRRENEMKLGKVRALSHEEVFGKYMNKDTGR